MKERGVPLFVATILGSGGREQPEGLGRLLRGSGVGCDVQRRYPRAIQECRLLGFVEAKLGEHFPGVLARPRCRAGDGSRGALEPWSWCRVYGATVADVGPAV